MVIFRNDTLNHRVDWEAVTVLKQEPIAGKEGPWRSFTFRPVDISPILTVVCPKNQYGCHSLTQTLDFHIPPFFRIQIFNFPLYLIVRHWPLYLFLVLFCTSVQSMKVHRMNILNRVLIHLDSDITYAATSLYNTELITALASLRLVITCNRWQCYQVKQDIVL